MTQSPAPGLLPSGLSDLLAPDAGFEAQLLERLIGACESRGYERVKPPMMEFEDSLLSGTGAAMDRQVFRLMDPVSQRMMGLRADITPQIARIAETRLGGAPRPLRLCYAGQVLRVCGDQIRPERQFAQIGAELIGSENPAADAEVIRLGHDALKAVGITGLSVDLGVPTLVASLLADQPDLARSADLRDALDHKDTGALDGFFQGADKPAVGMLRALVAASGPAEKTIKAVAAIDLPAPVRREWDGLLAVVDSLSRQAPDMTLTIDPVEHRGFEYHAGVTFTIYAANVRGELGSGGRYRAGAAGQAGAGEPATGFTLFTDSLLRALPRPETNHRLYVPFAANARPLDGLRADGWITVMGLEPTDQPTQEAQRLGCGHWLDGDTPAPVGA
ncbi:MAG: ATP phosphoribosyltransferase regulatory subunit [Rhodospirillaceae bacterium]